MSVVSSMIIVCGLCEDEPDGPLAALNAWTEAFTYPWRFEPLDDAKCGGFKAMQNVVLAAAMNYFDEDAIAELFPTLPWAWPEDALLIIQPEEGRPRIVRADGSAE